VNKKRIPQTQESIKAYRASPRQAYEEITFDILDRLNHLGLLDLDLGENEKVVSPRAMKLLVDMDFDVDGIEEVSWQATRGRSKPAVKVQLQKYQININRVRGKVWRVSEVRQLLGQEG
jgi:hypothetical protein